MASCASGPSAERYLDERTGVTVSKVRAPLVMYRSESAASGLPRPFAQAASDFMTLAPFEVNRQGDYRLYLWVEWPAWATSTADGGAPPAVVFFLDNERLAVEPIAPDLRSLGVASPIYTPAEKTARIGYYALSWPQFRRITSANDLGVGAGGGSPVFKPWGRQAAVFESFHALASMPRPTQ